MRVLGTIYAASTQSQQRESILADLFMIAALFGIKYSDSMRLSAMIFNFC